MQFESQAESLLQYLLNVKSRAVQNTTASLWRLPRSRPKAWTGRSTACSGYRTGHLLQRVIPPRQWPAVEGAVESEAYSLGCYCEALSVGRHSSTALGRAHCQARRGEARRWRMSQPAARDSGPGREANTQQGSLNRNARRSADVRSWDLGASLARTTASDEKNTCHDEMFNRTLEPARTRRRFIYTRAT